MMRKFSITFLVALQITLLLVIVSGPVTASGQGLYRGRAYTKGDVERIIKRVEDRSDSFRKIVDRSLDRSALDGTRREDNINEQVKQFEKALDELRSEFSRQDRWLETRHHVEKVLSEAGDVNAIVRRHFLRPVIEREWALLRADINRLAGVYDLRTLK
jgi:hypothetical protein